MGYFGGGTSSGVTGPISCVDGNLVAFLGTNGKRLADSGRRAQDFALAGHEHDIIAEASEEISALKCVLFEDGLVKIASCLNPAHADRIAGLAISAADERENISVRTRGVLEDNSWNWSNGALLYCGTDGSLTQIPPQNGFVQIVGIALSNKKILIALRQAVQLDN